MSLYVLVMGPICLAIALATRNPLILYRAGIGGIRLGTWLSGVTTDIQGAEHLQHSRAAVYAVNHASNVEPPLIFDAFDRSSHGCEYSTRPNYGNCRFSSGPSTWRDSFR